MALNVVSEKTQTSTMQITIRGSSPEPLTDRQTREEVLLYARSKGFQARGLKEIPNPYPVDAAGQTNHDVITGKTPVVAWQADYEVAAGL